MNTTRSPQNHQLTWVCPSVGYLIGDLASELFVKPYDTTGQISLQVATTSVSTCGRPKHSIDKKPSFRDDCAFLLVKECDLHTFQCVISNVNPFYLIPDLPGQVDILDPLSISRFCDIEWTMQTNHLIVYKHGSSTQLTVGRLVKMTRHPPRGWYNGNSRNNLENEMDENEWMGVVDWNGLPFSSPSDSGSLISRLRTVYMFHLEFMFLLMSS
ncbi:hypothetical protein BDV29DRAFT_164576 [Aspergillus leporis]|uniref:Uncharacterized protein n=1 Tax=Aspergillus leporis TaxID=41062 RepID=A0A5N5XFL0_9EURO|nr:hypothetical protein BDV29DRAFT_164576 [Aspergillus leporis]